MFANHDLAALQPNNDQFTTEYIFWNSLSLPPRTHTGNPALVWLYGAKAESSTGTRS